MPLECLLKRSTRQVQMPYCTLWHTENEAWAGNGSTHLSQAFASICSCHASPTCRFAVVCTCVMYQHATMGAQLSRSASVPRGRLVLPRAAQQLSHATSAGRWDADTASGTAGTVSDQALGPSHDWPQPQRTCPRKWLASWRTASNWLCRRHQAQLRWPKGTCCWLM